MRNGRLLQAAMIFLAIVAVFLVFDYSSHVCPWYISAAAALSLAGVYVGIGFTDIARNRRTFAMTISLVAMAIEAVYGTLAVLRRISPEWFAGPQPAWVIWTEAVLHGAPFTVLLAMIVFLVVHHEDEADVTHKPIYVVAQPLDTMIRQLETLQTPAPPDDSPVSSDETNSVIDLDQLRHQYGTIEAAAKALGMSRATIYRHAKGESR